MEDVKIFEQVLYSTDESRKPSEVGKMAIIFGGLSSNNPKLLIDKAVADYVEDCAFCQFTDIHLDNPWVRVIIKGINTIPYTKFDAQKLCVNMKK